jgi:NADP-dependent 3-hydroxy acid dehydrogenase YdfG
MNDETRNFIGMRTKSFDRNGSDHGRLEEKVAIITGAGTGIGEAIAHKFAKERARVVLCGLRDDPIEDVAKAIRENKGKAVAFAGDISEERAAKQCVDLAIKEFQRLDVLVNNAGVFLDNAMTQPKMRSFSVPCGDAQQNAQHATAYTQRKCLKD